MSARPVIPAKKPRPVGWSNQSAARAGTPTMSPANSTPSSSTPTVSATLARLAGVIRHIWWSLDSSSRTGPPGGTAGASE